ncbi:MAG: hypothetical protein AAB403_16410, partial [Planctomycetota bacterium]
ENAGRTLPASDIICRRAAGHNGGMSPANILVYEPRSVHDGRWSILRLGGQLELLTPEVLQQAKRELPIRVVPDSGGGQGTSAIWRSRR